MGKSVADTATVDPARGIGEVVYAPLDVILSDTSIVQPDIVYLETARLGGISRRGVEGPPTLAVEIVSPSTTLIDRSIKPQLYAHHAVPFLNALLKGRESAFDAREPAVHVGLKFLEPWYAFDGMAIHFVIILENRAGRTPEEINQALTREPDWDEWISFSHEGRAYASWQAPPRYFWPEESPERWEALRKYLVRAREFLGGGAVFIGNDVASPSAPEDASDEDPFFLPLQAPDEWLAAPDATAQPDLARIQELAGLTW